MKDFVLGASCLLRGLARLREPELRRHALAPLLLSALALAAVLGGGLLLGLGPLWEGLTGWLPDWLDWSAWLLVPLALMALLVVAAFLWVPLAHLLAGPFNDALAAAVARRLGHAVPQGGGWREALLDLLRGLRLATLGLAGAAALGLLALVPGLGLLAPVGWVVLGAWVMAWEHLAYPLAWAPEARERAQERLRRRRALRWGFGLAALALASFPVLNLLAVPAAVAGAVELWHRAAALPTRPSRNAR